MIRKVISELKKYVVGRKNTEKTEVSVLNLNRLIFALEDQESALDKIRAEIMKLQTYKMFGGEDTVYVEHEDVLQIIDKYREGEVSDADTN